MAFNGGAGIVIDGDASSLDASVASRNADHGIVVRGAATRLQNTEVSYNGGDGLHLYAIVDVDDHTKGTCNGGRLVAAEGITLPPAPRVTMAIDDLTAFTVVGDLTGTPNTAYVVQALALPSVCNLDHPAYGIGSTTVTTDAHGYATFRIVAGRGYGTYNVTLERMAATARLASHPSSLSELSPVINATLNTDHRVDLAVSTTGPTTTSIGSDVTFDTVVSNGGPAAIYNAVINIALLPGAQLVSFATERGHCVDDRYCYLDALGPGDTAVIHHKIRFLTTGVFTYSVNASFSAGFGDIDPNPGNNQGQVTVRVDKTSRRRAVVH
jgi:hypothetical protein